MTEEEKKAIEKIKELEKLTREESKERNPEETQKLYKEYADYYLILLNLIEKQQKENKILKEENYNIERKYQDYRILSVGITQLEMLIREARVISEAEERDEKTKEYYKTRLKCLLDLYSELYNSKTILDYIPKDKIRELLEEHSIELGEDTIAMSEQGAFAFMLSIKELLEEE